MFESQINTARQMIARLVRCQTEGLDQVPPDVPIPYEEHIAWHDGTERLVIRAFGADSVQVRQWRELMDRRSEMVGKAIKDHKDSLQGYIYHLNALIVLLTEFQSLHEHASKSDGSHSVKDQSVEHTADPAYPDSLQKALLRTLWGLHPVLRMTLLILAGVALLAFVVWKALPDTVKVDIIKLFR